MVTLKPSSTNCPYALFFYYIHLGHKYLEMVNGFDYELFQYDLIIVFILFFIVSKVYLFTNKILY